MTEFEVATLELQRAMLTAQYAAVMDGRRGGFCAVRAHRLGSFFHASRCDRAGQGAGHTHEASGGGQPRAANPHRTNE